MPDEDHDAAAFSPEHHYNKIFERLVGGIEDGNDANLRGLLAYGFYKVAKREWVAQYREKHGKPPSGDELQRYADTWTKSQLKSTEDRADQVLAEYAGIVIQSEEPAILRRALKGSFLSGVFQSITANIIYTIILIVITIILLVNGVDILSVLKNMSEFKK